jgi:hypothetical protein
MIPFLLAATLAIANPGLQKDLSAPAQRLVDSPVAAPLSKDLRAPPPGKSLRSFVLPLGAPLPPGAILSGSAQRLYAGALCQKKAVPTSGPQHLTLEGLKKLGDLPPGLLEHAVNRLVNGCPVREIVMGGQTYYLVMPVATLDRVDPTAYAPARGR